MGTAFPSMARLFPDFMSPPRTPRAVIRHPPADGAAPASASSSTFPSSMRIRSPGHTYASASSGTGRPPSPRISQLPSSAWISSLNLPRRSSGPRRSMRICTWERSSLPASCTIRIQCPFSSRSPWDRLSLTPVIPAASISFNVCTLPQAGPSVP